MDEYYTTEEYTEYMYKRLMGVLNREIDLSLTDDREPEKSRKHTDSAKRKLAKEVREEMESLARVTADIIDEELEAWGL